RWCTTAFWSPTTSRRFSSAARNCGRSPRSSGGSGSRGHGGTPRDLETARLRNPRSIMARGFESKSVQEQWQDAEAAADMRRKPKKSAEQIEMDKKREGLEMSRRR